MSAWPSIVWIARRSAPPSSRWLANECRRTGGETGCRRPGRARAGGPRAHRDAAEGGAAVAQARPAGLARRAPAARVHEQPAGVSPPRVRRADVAEIPRDPLHGLPADGDGTLLLGPVPAHHVA